MEKIFNAIFDPNVLNYSLKIGSSELQKFYDMAKEGKSEFALGILLGFLKEDK